MTRDNPILSFVLRVALWSLLFSTCHLKAVPLACFSTQDVLGCAPYTVTLQECTQGGTGIMYRYKEANESVFSDWIPAGSGSFQIVFDKPGTYTIHQIIQAACSDGCNIKRDHPPIRVIAPVRPKFEVYLCNNRKVSVKITDNQFPNYFIDFGDGTAPVAAVSNSNNIHTYPDLTPRTITVTGTLPSGSCPTAADTVVVPTEIFKYQRYFNVENTNEAKEQYKFSLPVEKSLHYTFYSSAGHMVKAISDKQGLETFVLSDVQDSCYYLESTNICGDQYITSSLCLSPVNATLSDTSVKLSWAGSNPQNVDRYIVYRDDGSGNTEMERTKALFYEDLDVKCGKRYCYTVATKLLDSTSLQVERCIVAVSNIIPDAPEKIYSTFNDANSLSITWAIPGGNSFKSAELRSMPSNKVIYTGDRNEYISPTKSNGCYKLNYVDSCNKTSELVQNICPIWVEVIEKGQGLYEINWNEYSPAQGMQYRLYEGDQLIYEGNSTYHQTTTQDTINQIKIFKVIGTSPEISTQSNTVILEQAMKVYFPTAFTPNGDGVNDTFAPKIRYVKAFKLAVYDIWGSLVFTTGDISQPWTGQGHPNGTYNYVAETQDYLGNTKQHRGQVSILK